jgi:hypothetical protein
MNPYTDLIESEASVIRVFDQNIDPIELKWHRDLEDRRIIVLDGSGWYYQKEDELPITLQLWLHKCESKPYRIENNRSYYQYEIDQSYMIEIYKHEQMEDTSVISEILDDDETPMSVCFFPTYRHKIWFNVI